jgi:hypothetical protein
MAYAGMVPSEHSSGGNARCGSITKTGNAHLRRVIVETAWHCRHAPGVSGDLRKRQREVPSTSLHDRLECTTTAQQALSASPGSWKDEASDRSRHRPRTAGVHLGDRFRCQGHVAATCGSVRTATMSLTHDAGPEAVHDMKRDAQTHVPPRFPAPKTALRLLSSITLSSA